MLYSKHKSTRGKIRKMLTIFSFSFWIRIARFSCKFYFGNFLGTKATNVPIFPPLVITSSLLPSPVMEVGDSKWGLMLVTKMKNVVLPQIDHGKLYSYFPLVDSAKETYFALRRTENYPKSEINPIKRTWNSPVLKNLH